MSSSVTANNLMTFGKYKGKPIAKVLADKGYCKWLRQPEIRASPGLSNHEAVVEFIVEETQCEMCQDNPKGMYGGDDCHIKCPGCGGGGNPLFK